MVKRVAGSLLHGLTVNRCAPESLTHQLSVQLRALVLGGDLAVGERLPATRTLARELGVSRTTVVEVYEQLVAEGLLASRTGAGTCVSAALQHRPALDPVQLSAAPPCVPRLSAVMAEAIGAFAGRISHQQPRTFVTSLPAYAEFPMALWSRKMGAHWRQERAAVLAYGDAQGYFPLRRAISHQLGANRGIDCDPEQVFVVGGAQQAFQLIAHVLLDRGDKVWFENPGPIGLRNALVASGAHTVPVPVDEEGLDVAAGNAMAADFRLAFCTPSHQQPTAVSMSLARRLMLLRAAERAGAMVVEDDYDGEFNYRGRPPPALKSLDTRGSVIYVGTFSKTLFPALRIGYIVVPSSLVAVFKQITQAFLQGNPSNLQAVVADFMDSGDFATHVRCMSALYAERHDMLCDLVDQELGDTLKISRPQSGMNTVAWLRPGLSEQAMVTAAAQQGVTLEGVGRYCLTPLKHAGVTFGFSGFSVDEITLGVQKLKVAFSGLRA